MIAMGNKYNAQKTVMDGISFDSRKEAQRYFELKMLERAKEISGLKLQVKFEIIPKQIGENAAHYVCDFMYEENGKTIVEDVKGMKTKEYILKRKLFKLNYPQYVFKEV